MMPVTRGRGGAHSVKGVTPSDIFCDICQATCQSLSNPFEKAACYAICEATVC